MHLRAQKQRSGNMGRTLSVACATILVLSLGIATWPQRPTSLRQFDADRIAGLEVRMWQAYYDKERVRLFGLLVVMLREQFHFSWATATGTAFRLARAAATFGDATGDYEAVLPDLTRAYESIRAHSDGTFEPSDVAQAELAWWVARRLPDSRAPEHVGALIAREYAEMYSAPVEDMTQPGVLRARAAALRDAEAGRPDWPTIAGLLHDSYRMLHARLATAPPTARTIVSFR